MNDIIPKISIITLTYKDYSNLFKTIKSILEQDCPYFEYIISAYECKTFDFIQKPFPHARLEKTILRLFDDLKYESTNFIHINNKNQLINQDLINFIQKDG